MEGILKRTLIGVQLSIFKDKIKPEEVLESYNFNFQYGDNSDGAERKAFAIAYKGPDGSPVAIRSVRSGLENMIWGLVASQQLLPELPGQFEGVRQQFLF